VPDRKEKIAAVVVTYNRKSLLEECLDSLLGQSRPLDAVYVIDNHSIDGTHDRLLAREWISPTVDSPGPVETVRPVPVPGLSDCRLDIHYVRLPENTGGAGGFHEGMKRAFEAGFGWLWLMDDDLLAAPDALEVLVRQADALRSRRQESFILNSLVFVRDQPDGDSLALPLQEFSRSRSRKSGIHSTRRGICHWRLSEVRDQVKDGLYRWACPFNGTFVPARAVREVGLPNREFFIWGDERDWLWRAARRFDFYTAVDSKVFHPMARIAHFDWRHYYLIRNAFVVNRHFDLTGLRDLRLVLWSLATGTRHGWSGLVLVLRAIRDGLTGRLGKRDGYPP